MKIQITLEAQDGRNVTAWRVENILEQLPNFSMMTAKTNAARGIIESGVWKIRVTTDKEARETLRLDSSAALDVLRAGVPCGSCPDKYACAFCCGDTNEEPKDCEQIQKFRKAEQQILDARHFCNRDCSQFAHGTCPFASPEKCPSYEFAENTFCGAFAH